MKKRGQYEVQDAYDNANTSHQGLGVRELRGALRELSVEATANVPTSDVRVPTPLGEAKGRRIAERIADLPRPRRTPRRVEPL